MASPRPFGRDPETAEIEEFLRNRICLAKEGLQAAERELERTPYSRDAKARYAESFYQYCRALYQASMYMTRGVIPPDFPARARMETRAYHPNGTNH